MDYKRFFSEDFLRYLWKGNIHGTSQMNSISNSDVTQKVVLRNLLPVCCFGNEIGEIRICHGTTK